jgi:hypothetical protein
MDGRLDIRGNRVIDVDVIKSKTGRGENRLSGGIAVLL